MTVDEHRGALRALRRDIIPTPRGEAFERWQAEETAKRLGYLLEVAGLGRVAGDPAVKYLEQVTCWHDEFELASLCVLLEAMRSDAARALVR